MNDVLTVELRLSQDKTALHRSYNKCRLEECVGQSGKDRIDIVDYEFIRF